jgi:hypothetical protein
MVIFQTTYQNLNWATGPSCRTEQDPTQGAESQNYASVDIMFCDAINVGGG